MKGFYGRGLRVYLGESRAEVFELKDEDLALLGGKGLGTRLLLAETAAGTDPLGPGNAVIFTTGPLAGTKMPGASRYGVYTKSPLTGGYGEAYSGGHVAPVIKATGFDAIVIKGHAKEPVYLAISPEGAEFRSAKALWGKDTYETEEALLAASPKGAQAVVIGPAGENLVLFSCLENNKWRSAGRCGFGAVFGAMKLKGVVFRGDRKAPLHDEAALEAYAKELTAAGKDNPGVAAYKAYGTPNMVRGLNAAGSFPTRYWHKGRLDGWESISAQRLAEKNAPKARACDRCFIACGKLVKVQEGPHAGLELEGPEYETIYALGGLCELRDMDEVIYLNDLSDRLGMDTISLGNVLALTMEANALAAGAGGGEGGAGAAPGGAAAAKPGAPAAGGPTPKPGAAIPKLAYGDAAGAARLARDIAYGRGAGKLLGQGTRRVAEAWGLSGIAIHVKGLEPAGYDPRVLKGMGLAYATSPRGACHLRSTFYKAELSGQIDPNTVEGKAALFIDYEDRLALYDTLILCRFFRDLVMWPGLETAINAATGLGLDKAGLERLASEVVSATRRFNYREGFTAADDQLPARFFDEPLPEKGDVITREAMSRMLAEYYALRGWDSEGRPAER